MNNKYMIHFTYNEIYRFSNCNQRVEKKSFTFFTEESDYNIEEHCKYLSENYDDFCVINISKL